MDHVDLTVLPVPDNAALGTRTVVLNLTANAAFTIDPSRASATVTLMDDDPIVGVVATGPAHELGLVPGTFTFTRSVTTSSPLTVTYSITGTAKSGTNYLPIPTSVTIPANAASAAITVTPKKDTVARGPLSVIVTLAPGTAAGDLYSCDPAHKSDTLTLIDDQPVVSIEATQPNAADFDAAQQDQVPALFTVKRSLVNASPLTVHYTVKGTAINGTDYTAIPTSVVIPANAASIPITVTPKDNHVYKPTQTIILTLTPVTTTYSVDPASPSANGTLSHNEAHRGRRLDPGRYRAEREPRNLHSDGDAAGLGPHRRPASRCRRSPSRCRTPSPGRRRMGPTIRSRRRVPFP